MATWSSQRGRADYFMDPRETRGLRAVSCGPWIVVMEATEHWEVPRCSPRQGCAGEKPVCEVIPRRFTDGPARAQGPGAS